MEGNIYLKHRESNVEILDQASVSLVGLLHERHQHVFLTLFRRTFTQQFINLETILWVSPETVCNAKRETIHYYYIFLFTCQWRKKNKFHVGEYSFQCFFSSDLFFQYLFWWLPITLMVPSKHNISYYLGLLKQLRYVANTIFCLPMAFLFYYFKIIFIFCIFASFLLIYFLEDLGFLWCLLSLDPCFLGLSIVSSRNIFFK